MPLYAWGANSYGQLGIGVRSEQEEIPTPVPGFDQGVSILAGGGGHSFLLDKNGALFSCGWNVRGQLGLGHRDNVEKHEPVPLPVKDDKVVSVSCGWDFTVVVTESGKAFGTGSNAFGQLGLGDDVKGIDAFVPIPNLSDITVASCGLRHSLFLTKSGKIFGSGSSKRGQLGLEDQTACFDCVQLSHLPDEHFEQIAAGQHFSLALTRSGKLYGFGENKHGEVMGAGAGGSEHAHEIVLPDLPDTIDKITCGWAHGIVRLKNNKVFSWGRNDYNQLGNSDKDLKGVCGCTEVNLEASDIDAGSEHCLAVRLSDKKLVSWGWNEHGNCGTGTVTNVPTPTEVVFGKSYSLVDCFCAASGHNFAFVME